MKKRFYTLTAVAALVLFIFFSENCFAWGSVDDGCDNGFWTDECQNFIHNRDYRRNLRQIPKNTFRSNNDHIKNSQKKHGRNPKTTHSTSPFLNMYLKDYSDVRGDRSFTDMYLRDYSDY